MNNLLEETLEALSAMKKTPAEVRWVGHVEPEYLKGIGEPETSLPFGSWDEFARFANFDYDDGYGGAQVSTRLVVVGDDWWLERVEYDGSEWWEFKSLPRPPVERMPLRADDLRDRP